MSKYFVDDPIPSDQQAELGILGFQVEAGSVVIKGERMLLRAGSRPLAYMAKNDLSCNHQIAKLVLLEPKVRLL